VASPLNGRYVDAGSVFNVSFSTTPTLGINTVKISNVANDFLGMFGIELIAQDTTSTATKSQIQIPSQNVVSYGKKFTVAETKHYNPFAFKTDGSTAWTSGNHNGTAWPIGTGSSTNIDTATSLGLAAWVSTNYYYPYNGGRVVKWVASDGTIKTSVNMMPPNARNIGPTAAAEKGDDSAGTTSAAVANDTYLPTFTDQAIDHSQAEVAKTFHVREFGNGAANGGAGATYADASMLNVTNDDIAYVMDDGLTSYAGSGVSGVNSYLDVGGWGSSHFITFIGTGLSYTPSDGISRNVAQNLPYGTHIFNMKGNSSSAFNHYLDGQLMESSSSGTHYTLLEATFHQPKRPPIPEDAVVIADYMLMADFVPQTADGQAYISKGVRLNDVSRDVFINATGSETFTFDFYVDGASGYRVYCSAASAGDSVTFRLPSFGTNIVHKGYASGARSLIHIDTTAQTVTKTAGTVDNQEAFQHITTSKTLGVYNWGTDAISGTNGLVSSYQIATPIHTSSHYQSFETPFLHELVGGDRNMEQTNLVVTPDGKTWDEVTRDVSYIGFHTGFNVSLDGGDVPAASKVIWDTCRGSYSANFRDAVFKDFASAYNIMIVLKSGWYLCSYHLHGTQNDHPISTNLQVNGNPVLHAKADAESDERSNVNVNCKVFLNRGDTLGVQATSNYIEGADTVYSSFHATLITG